MPVAVVRRRSCRRQAGRARPYSFAAAASSSDFAFDQPLTGVSPLVVNTKSPAPMRGSDSISLAAVVDSGMVCGSPFLVRAPASSIVAPSISDRQSAPISSRRAAVRMRSCTAGPNGQPTLSAAFHTAASSASTSTRSRFTAFPGFGKSVIGFTARIPRPTDQRNSLCKCACKRRAMVTAPRSTTPSIRSITSRRLSVAIRRPSHAGLTSRSMTRLTSAAERLCTWSRLSHSSATAGEAYRARRLARRVLTLGDGLARVAPRIPRAHRQATSAGARPSVSRRRRACSR